MSRWRRIGLSLTFAATLSSGVLMSQPARADTPDGMQCARLHALVTFVTGLAADHPDNQFLAFVLQRLMQIESRFCGE